MKKVLLKWSLPVIGLVLFLSFQNCSDVQTLKALGSGSASSSQSNNLDGGIVNQSPLINCRLLNNKDKSLLQEINTLSSKDIFVQPIIEGESISFDCGKTTDDTNKLEELSFQINYNVGVSGYENVSSQFLHTFPTYGTYNVSIQVSDKDNHVTEKSFTLYVQCATAGMGARAALLIDSSKVKISAAGQVGYFNYDATGAVTGGSGAGTYQYSWDFDGDGVFDPFDVITPKAWSTSASENNVYTQFGNSRKVGLMVRDQCNFFSTAYVNNTFDIPGIAAGQQASVKPYYYLQTDVRPSSAADTALTSNVDFIGTQLPTTPLKRVQCTYNKKSAAGVAEKTGFNISAINYYDDKSNPRIQHGLDLHISNILDMGTNGLQSFSSASGTNPILLDKLNYSVAEKGDGSANFSYSKNAGCTVNLRIQRAQAVTPCSTDPTLAMSDVVIFLGEFNCPSLSSAGHTDVLANNGYFYCEVSLTNQCSGGGGGGGGQPPLPQ